MLVEAKKNWERLAESDPLFFILSDPNKRGRRWNVAEFFGTGTRVVEEILSNIESTGGLSARRRALDFGCGVGRLTQPLATHFEEVIGVDISSKMVELATGFNCASNCKFIVNDRSDLSLFPDRHFDFIISLLTLQHMSPKIAKRYIPEFLRTLSPGGIAYFGLPEGPRKSSGIKTRVGAWLVEHPYAYSVYRAALRKTEAGAEMHGMKKRDVTALIESAGGKVRSIAESHDERSKWLGYHYVTMKI